MGPRSPILRRLRWLVGALCWTVGAVAAQGALQDQVRIEYRAPSDCPTQAEFETQISTRLSNLEPGREGIPLRVLSVEVDSTGASWRARLELSDEHGTPMSRSVTASSCDAAVDAVALATALLLEPGPPNETEPRERPALATTTPRQRQSTSERHEPPARSSERKPLALQTEASRMRPEIGASGGVTTGIGPAIAYGATLFGGWSLDATLTRIGVVVAQTPYGATDIAGVRLRQRLLAAKLEHCPYQLALGRSTGLHFCASVAAGILLSDGKGASEVRVLGRGSRVFWLMAGLSPKLRHDWAGSFLEFELFGFIPVTRRQFEVTGEAGASELAYRTPITVFGAALSIGTHFQ